METIHGAELVLLSLPDRDELLGGILTIAMPMGKNWHWLSLEEYVTEDAMLEMALEGYGRDTCNVVSQR